MLKMSVATRLKSSHIYHLQFQATQIYDLEVKLKECDDELKVQIEPTNDMSTTQKARPFYSLKYCFCICKTAHLFGTVAIEKVKLKLGMSRTASSHASRENRSRIRKLSTEDGVRPLRVILALVGAHGPVRAHIVAYESPRLDGRGGFENGCRSTGEQVVPVDEYDAQMFE